MSKIKSFRLPEGILRKLANIARRTHRSETFYISQALQHYFDDYLDAQIGKDRFDDPKKKIMSSDEFWSTERA